ncbi:MAG: hypothetical protein BWY17_02009 [Deltaproteobacteria bacterium ADurb.Bin207]|jgi:hypothetical protein|nr:MAG: hypothetical protein BWY17_02009 [Deltaproteobacteria bacterium ADurb.Bin207]
MTIVLDTIIGAGIVGTMSRQKNPDRSSVTSREGPSVAIRLTDAEYATLQAIVEEQQATADAAGIVTRVTPSSVLRSLIRAAAQARGLPAFSLQEGASGAAKPKARKTTRKAGA